MKFHIHTLGCKVNAYESRVMADILKNAGYIESDEAVDLDISVINTCSVTNSADSKSAKIIRSQIRKNKDAIIIVTGCFSQSSVDIVKSIDGVNIILGNKFKTELIPLIEKFRKTKEQIIKVENIMKTDFESMKLNNFNRTRAFVKIQDGCNNFCSFCIIPYVRGNVRSKKREEVLSEIRELTNNGHKEIVLTGIHTGNYGIEFENYKFSDLLADVLKIRGLERLRISSIEMNEIDDDVLKLIKENKILVDHMHIPLQSGCDKILKDMNRKYNLKDFKNKINELRKIRPNVSITTDVIVGFPGESEKEFNETIETINDLNFSKLHVFPYSKRKGTVAAEMGNHVDERVKKERVSKLLEISKDLELKYMEKFLNSEIIFIPEKNTDKFIVGHSGNYLSIKTDGNKEDLGKQIKVKIEKIEYPYLIGKRKN
jgi:MiaB-like tRNA modifying enzyme